MSRIELMRLQICIALWS